MRVMEQAVADRICREHMICRLPRAHVLTGLRPVNMTAVLGPSVLGPPPGEPADNRPSLARDTAAGDPPCQAAPATRSPPWEPPPASAGAQGMRQTPSPAAREGRGADDPASGSHPIAVTGTAPAPDESIRPRVA
jgi:hypothetical protein